MIKHIKPIPLLIGIAIGVIGIMFMDPEKNVTYKYPTPEDNGKTAYKDKNGICYRYRAKEVDCDKNESKLKEFPLSK
jgi:hypothetical protein